MAYVSAKRIGEGREYSETFEPKKGIVREFVDVYRVKVSSQTDSGLVALSGADVPQFGQVHPEDSGAWVKGRRADKGNLRFGFDCYITYSSAFNEEEQEDNPLNERVKRRWGTVKVMKPAVKDRNGNLILSKAKTQYDPPLEKPSRHVILSFTRNEASFSGDSALEFVDKVNSGTFSGAEPGKLLIDDISAEEAFKNDLAYWVVNYDFEYNPDGWQPEVLEQSLMELKEGKLIRIKDKLGEDVTQPVPIDANGAAIPASSLPDAAIATKWDIYHEVDVTQLNLPA